MATKVYTSEELELQDGSKVTVKPLTIKRLRQFMKVINKLNSVEGLGEADDEVEDETLELMVEACAIAIAQSNKELAEDRERLEDALDIPTMWKILEVAGGIQMGNAVGPMAAGLAGKS